MRVKLQISQTNKLAKQNKTNLDQATNANLDTKQFFKIPNNPNSIKAFFVNFNPNQTTATFEITTA